MNNSYVKQIAEALGVSEQEAVGVAINRLYYQLFAEVSDYPTQEQVRNLNELYGEHTDHTLSSKSILDR